MDIQQLRYVREIARLGSVRAAAAALFIAPQTLSEQLRRVERGLGAELFERRADGMRPTRVGEAFVAHAVTAVDAFDEALVAIRRAASAQGTGAVRLAWAYGVADVLRELLRQLTSAAPELDVEVVSMGCAEQFEALARRELSAGLVHHVPGAPRRGGVRRVVVDSQPAHALLAASDPLVEKESVELAELTPLPLLLPAASRTACLREWELAEFAEHGLTPRLGSDVTSIEQAVSTVATGGGYALCVRVGHPVGEDVVFVPVVADADVRPQQVALAWTPDTPAAVVTAARALRDRSTV